MSKTRFEIYNEVKDIEKEFGWTNPDFESFFKENLYSQSEYNKLEQQSDELKKQHSKLLYVELLSNNYELIFLREELKKDIQDIIKDYPSQRFGVELLLKKIVSKFDKCLSGFEVDNGVLDGTKDLSALDEEKKSSIGGSNPSKPVKFSYGEGAMCPDCDGTGNYRSDGETVIIFSLLYKCKKCNGLGVIK